MGEREGKEEKRRNYIEHHSMTLRVRPGVDGGGHGEV